MLIETTLRNHVSGPDCNSSCDYEVGQCTAREKLRCIDFRELMMLMSVLCNCACMGQCGGLRDRQEDKDQRLGCPELGNIGYRGCTLSLLETAQIVGNPRKDHQTPSSIANTSTS